MAHIDAGKTTTHRAHPLLHRHQLQDRRGPRRHRRRWTGWSRSRSAASRSPPPPPPASGATTASTSSTRPGHVDFTVEVERSPARARRRGRGLLRASAASSRSPRRSGARPTSTACRASRSSTRWTASAPTSTASSQHDPRPPARQPGRRSSSRSAPRSTSAASIDLVTHEGDRLGRREPRRRAIARTTIPADLRGRGRGSTREAARGGRRRRRGAAWRSTSSGEADHRGRDPRRAPQGHARAEARAGALRLGLQEQGRAAAARRASSTTCRRRSTCRRCKGIDPDTARKTSAQADGRRAVLRARVQDHDRPVRRHADLLPRLLRRARARGRTSTTRREGHARSASAASSRCTPTSARRSRRSTPATSPPPSACATRRTGDTLCDEDNPIVLERMEFPEPVISIAIEPKTKADQEKLGGALQKLAHRGSVVPRVAPTRRPARRIISGMGELHLEIIVDRLLREFKVDANVGKPQVAYRETIRKTVEQEAQVHPPDRRPRPVRPRRARARAAAAGRRLRVRERHQGRRRSRASTSRRSRRASSEALEAGVLAGYPVVDVKVDADRRLVPRGRLVGDGVQDRRLDGVQGGAARRRSPVLLEPIMTVEVVAPEEFMGDVIGDLNRRRGRIQGMEPRGGAQVIAAHGAAGGDVRLRDRPALARPRGARPTRCSSRTTSRCRRRSPRRSRPRPGPLRGSLAGR